MMIQSACCSADAQQFAGQRSPSSAHSRRPVGLPPKKAWTACLWVWMSVVGAASVGQAQALAEAAAPHESPRPNVVLIISDDQAWSDYGFMGHPHIQTPNLDRLAEQSLTFTRGYVPDSLCRPSLATIISGLYPHQHKISGNDPAPLSGLNAAQSRGRPAYRAAQHALIAHVDQMPTLPKWLATRDYLSLQTGKWWEGNYARGGFTHGMTRGFPEPGGRHGDDGLKIGREGLQPIYDFIAEAKQQQRPFFVWYAPFLPHTPHTPPDEILARYQNHAPSLPIAKYWAMCEWFDQTCGELLDHLDAQGLRENTMVVYVTDNGWINRADRSAYAPRSKRSPNEGGVRTPIMVRYPPLTRPLMDDSTLASSVDIAPTVLAACGIDAGQELPGINLLDVDARQSRTQVFGEIYSHDVADVDRPEASLTYRWTVRLPWKLIVPNGPQDGSQMPELYDLIDDPNEQTDLASKHPNVVQQLLDSL